MSALLRSRNLAVALLLTHQLAAGVAISLQPSMPSPWQVGGIVTWTATPTTGAKDALWYRFRARRIGSPFRVWKDFGPENTFAWTDADQPGTFEIEIAARDRATNSVSVATARYTLLTNADTNRPVIVPTSHPLVLLYSAPPCDTGARMKVRFQSVDGFTQDSPYKHCSGGLSMNFYIAGLRAQTEYFIYHVIDTGDSFEAAAELTYTTGKVSADLPATTILKAASPDAREPILLQENVFATQLATDLAGHVVW